jgi:hypothetical protein
MIHCLSFALVLSSSIMKSQNHRVGTDKGKIHKISITRIPQCLQQQKNCIIRRNLTIYYEPTHLWTQSRDTSGYKSLQKTALQSKTNLKTSLPSYFTAPHPFKRQIHYEVINWLVFKRRQIYSDIVSRYMMGVHTHIAITIQGILPFLLLLSWCCCKKPIRVQVIIKLGTARCTAIVNENSPPASAFLTESFVVSGNEDSYYIIFNWWWDAVSVDGRGERRSGYRNMLDYQSELSGLP